MRVFAWTLATIFYRIVVTTVPMASIIGAQASGRGYVLGGLTSGGFAVGELIGALYLSRRVPATRVVAWVRGAAGVASLLSLLGGAAMVWSGQSAYLAPALLLLTGAATAPFAGILRAAAGQSRDSDKIMAFDNVLNQVCWVIGPIVGVFGVHGIGTFPLFCIFAACFLIVAGTISGSVPPDFEMTSGVQTFPPLSQVALPIASSFVIMCVSAAFDTAVPIRLFESVGTDADTSWVLAALAAASVVGSALCLWRPSTSAMWRTAGVSTLAMSVGLGALSRIESFTALLVLAACIGFFQAPAMVYRQILVTRTISPAQLPGAFSLLYAAGAFGYSVSAAAVPIGHSVFGLSWTIIAVSLVLSALGVSLLGRSPNDDVGPANSEEV